MELPCYLPLNLEYLKGSTSSQEVLDKLIQHASDQGFLDFFESALEDSDWLQKEGKESFTLVLTFLLERYKTNRLTIEFVKKLTVLLQKYYSAINEILPEDLQVKGSSNTFMVNSLLLGALSHFLHEILISQVYVNKQAFLVLPSTDIPLEQLKEIIYSGTLAKIHIVSKDELLSLLKQGDSWHIDSLVYKASNSFKRYLTDENVFYFLNFSLKNHYFSLAHVCCTYLNHSLHEIRFAISELGDLQLDISKNSEETIAALLRIQLPIVDLGLHGPFINSSVQLLDQRLKSLDLSESSQPSEEFLDQISSLKSLNLTNCSWLSSAQLTRLLERLSSIEILILVGNPQLDIEAWSSLSFLSNLHFLDLSHCSLDEESKNFILLILSKSVKITY